MRRIDVRVVLRGGPAGTPDQFQTVPPGIHLDHDAGQVRDRGHLRERRRYCGQLLERRPGQGSREPGQRGVPGVRPGRLQPRLGRGRVPRRVGAELDDGDRGRAPVLAVVAVDVDRAGPPSRPGELLDPVGRNAVVAEGEVDVGQAVPAGGLDVRPRPVHRDHRLHAEPGQLGESQIPVRAAAAVDPLGHLEGVVQALGLDGPDRSRFRPGPGRGEWVSGVTPDQADGEGNDNEGSHLGFV